MRLGKRVAIAFAGGVVMLAGVVLLPLPGPGSVVIVLGLAILSLEFERPRVWLARLKAKGIEFKHRFEARRSQRRDG
jgi:uncharacterized protein (TIGR02611 family)